MLLSRDQKELILAVLKKENKRMLSGHKGPLLKKTIADFEQALRNEAINEKR
ncbi:hypothetical protein [Paenibacillus chitinolyticus]|uniref:hypothetical protein n=1 Tax=Paenibacillus TaxID=44249 RepID=UPI001C4525C2|nr:hypothetical protein [Paenibacillus chitinolyticus]MBV6714799.1 hypothetical protein [Paenibacillus chitinolyticus]